MMDTLQNAVLHEMGLQPGIRTITAMKLLDSERIRSAEKAVSDFMRQARRKNRLQKRRLEENDEETPAYEAGTEAVKSKQIPAFTTHFGQLFMRIESNVKTLKFPKHRQV
ncbi:hypothetical protein J6590_001455 [Homalodisca vitripennis]|nr:hypothetical protein J6590_001455 [Homalodisca vitripennis]